MPDVQKELTNPTQNKSPELLPCPFCGGPADEFSKHSKSHYIFCKRDCIPSFKGTYHEERDENIEQWNTRAQPEPKEPIARKDCSHAFPNMAGPEGKCFGCGKTHFEAYGKPALDQILATANGQMLGRNHRITHVCDEQCGGAINSRHCQQITQGEREAAINAIERIGVTFAEMVNQDMIIKDAVPWEDVETVARALKNNSGVK